MKKGRTRHCSGRGTAAEFGVEPWVYEFHSDISPLTPHPWGHVLRTSICSVSLDAPTLQVAVHRLQLQSHRGDVSSWRSVLRYGERQGVSDLGQRQTTIRTLGVFCFFSSRRFGWCIRCSLAMGVLVSFHALGLYQASGANREQLFAVRPDRQPYRG